MTIPASDLLEGISLEILAKIIDTNPGFASPAFGYLAEYWLEQQLKDTPGVSSVEKIPDHSKMRGDFLVCYEGKDYVVESKCASSYRVREDKVHKDKIGSVTLAGTDSVEADGVRTRSIERGRYDVLAICLKALTGGWDFVFINERYLPSAIGCPGRVRTSMVFTPGVTPFLFTELSKALA